MKQLEINGIESILPLNEPKLHSIDGDFIYFLKLHNPEALQKMLSMRQSAEKYQFISHEIMTLAVLVQEFIAQKFNLQFTEKTGEIKWQDGAKIYKIQRDFLQRHAVKYFTINPDEKSILDLTFSAFGKKYLTGQEFTILVGRFFYKEPNSVEKIQALTQYANWAINHINGQKKHHKDAIFNLPQNYKIKEKLPHIKTKNNITADWLSNKVQKYELRDEPTKELAAKETNYCLKCHNRAKDSCRLDVKKPPEDNGCPLRQRISEMIELAENGMTLSALAVAMIDNPLLILTGYRICNDCSRACIFTNQNPVDIPNIESSLATSLLQMDWGFELYNLLLQWNPLKSFDYIFKRDLAPTNTLIAGSGPAAIGLAYYLLNKGQNVTIIEGTGVAPLTKFAAQKPIQKFAEINHPMKSRNVSGFGGVMEYGITARWNKNYLNAIRILLERYDGFNVVSGVRFGNNFNCDDARNFGFNHLAIATGAGATKSIEIKGLKNHINIILASDFLMTWHLEKKYRKDQPKTQEPIIIIGAGLTAIDVAMELAYRIQHATPDITILCRNSLEKTPSYRQNHTEIMHALRCGAKILTHVEPIEIIYNFNEISGVKVNNGEILPCKTIILATGSVPNNSFAVETGNEEIMLENNTLKLQSDCFTNFTAADEFSATVFGDANKHYSGSVVKALASAKNGYKIALHHAKSHQILNKITPFWWLEKWHIQIGESVTGNTKDTNNKKTYNIFYCDVSIANLWIEYCINLQRAKLTSHNNIAAVDLQENLITIKGMSDNVVTNKSSHNATKKIHQLFAIFHDPKGINCHNNYSHNRCSHMWQQKYIKKNMTYITLHNTKSNINYAPSYYTLINTISSKKNKSTRYISELLKAAIKSIEKPLKDIYIIAIDAPFLYKKITPGDTIKIQILQDREWGRTIPLTVAKKYKNLIHIIVKNRGQNTNELCALKNGTEVLLSGPMGRRNKKQLDCIFTHQENMFLALAKSISSTQLIMPEIIDQQEFHYWLNFFDKSTDKISILPTNEINQNAIKMSINNHSIIAAIKPDAELIHQLCKIKNAKGAQIYHINLPEMGCMLGGVCGKCFSFNDQSFCCLNFATPMQI